MLGKNKLSKYKIEKIMECFCIDVEAIKTAQLLKLNRNTVHRYYLGFRRLIFVRQNQLLEKFQGELEMDESYFGANRVRGQIGLRKRGRGTHKQPVFGIYERGGRVYTEIIPDCWATALLPIIRGKAEVSSVIYSDAWRGYEGLVSVGYDKHVRIKKHSEGFAQKQRHINGIESFWSFTKRRLAKFYGVKKNFELHLKECEWRWNKNESQLRAELRSLFASRTKLSPLLLG